MFRFTAPAPRALAASAAFVLIAAAATAQATPSSTPQNRGTRRLNANRQARIARNIADEYTHRW